MVGGHALLARHERIFRFEFPERPGALMEFLAKIGGRWNISLFHYRNNGVDFDRVLAGFEVPNSDAREFEAMLHGLGLPYAEETENPAYRFFLEPGEEREPRLHVAGEHQA
jgi:threonine dehydratase